MRHPPEVLDLIDTVPHDRFFRYLDIFNKEIVVPTDAKVIAEVYQTKSDDYTKPSKGKLILEKVLGNGLIIAEGQDHKVRLSLTLLTRAFSDIVLVPKKAPGTSIQLQSGEEFVSSLLEEEF
jgi:hypothetical protein